MKTCVMCGKELPTPLDEYGAFHETKCWECFINEAKEREDSEMHKTLEQIAAFHELSLAIIEAKHE